MNVLSRLTLIAFCAGVAVLTFFVFSPSKKSTPTTTLAIIEESMTGVHVQRFDDGQLIQDIKMHSWLHYKGETVTQMICPSLRAYHRDGRIWDITSKQGEGFQAQMGGKLDKLHLSNDVVIQQLGQKSDFWWEMKTDNLLFFPQQPMALTDDPVVVNGPGIEVHAIGMRAYLDRHEIEFLKEVKCYYAKPQA